MRILLLLFAFLFSLEAHAVTCHRYGDTFPSVGGSLGVRSDTQIGPHWYAGFILGVRETCLYDPFNRGDSYYILYPVTGLLFEASQGNDRTALTAGAVVRSVYHLRYTYYEPTGQDIVESRAVSVGWKSVLELNVGIEQEKLLDESVSYKPFIGFGLGI